MSRFTEKLVRIIKNHAGEQDSSSKAQQYLQQGADLKALVKNSSLIDFTIAKEKQFRLAGLIYNADNCVRLIHVLIKHASDQLAAQVLSANNGNPNEMRQLVKLRANCYQEETFGLLGLLGELLNKSDTPIRLDTVQFLIENDPSMKYSWNTVDSQDQTCMNVAKKNSNCPDDVKNYLQQQFDMILNRNASNEPPIDPKEMIKWVQRGATLEVSDENGNTALCNAVIANNVDLTRVLISLGSNIAHKNRTGLTPRQIAESATSKNQILIGLLGKQGNNVELKSLIETKRSRLTVDEVRNHLEKGADINAKYANNDSLLHILIANHGTPEMITTFVNNFNADLSAMNINGLRAIELCVMVDKQPPFNRLLAFFKLSTTSTDLFNNEKLNKTLLQFANEQKRFDAAKLIQNELNYRLWNSMALMNTNNTNNHTTIDQLKQLINYGAQINYKYQDNSYPQWTILHLACKTTTKFVVQNLIENFKADYLLSTENGDYPISIAAEYGQLEIVEYLHDLPNLTLNISNRDRQTPLHLATRDHHLLVVKYLVRWGADPQARNHSNQTPLDIARANTANNKDEEINDKKLIEFFQQLICPSISGETVRGRKPDYDMDTCELAAPVEINTIQLNTDDAEGKSGFGKNGFLMRNHNDNLRDAAKRGIVYTAQQAIGNGADIRPRRGERSPFEIAQMSIQKCMTKLNNPALTLDKRSQTQSQLAGCQQIAMTIQQIARQKLVEAIDQSNASNVMAYHLAGAQLTVDLLQRTCNASDNVEIIDYLVNASVEIYQAMINSSSSMSLYHNAKKKNFDRLAAYLKYRLSIECGKAIVENNLVLVKNLVRDGASVDMINTNNIQEALKHHNVEMIQFLCQNGVKLPMEWLTSQSIVLPSTVSQQLKPEIKAEINRCLINRRLRFAAASGDLKTLIQCQRLGADINSVNCHGSTALLCTVQHGNYFPIVHALVSCGASMFHSNENEPSSLIDLAKKHNYIQIANYLSQQLNVQFLAAILNNEQGNAEKFSRLGVNFNYQDEQKRTPLYYAIECHNVELVKWLCECGCSPTSVEPDINGDYPITLATEKGNYSIVEFFVLNYAATRTQVNGAGLTALQIAEKLKYKRIAELIITGNYRPPAITDTEPPKLSYEVLKNAAENGPIETIKEFIKEQYDSSDEKGEICLELIHIAKFHKQLEIVDLLEPYYKTLQNKPSDRQYGDYVRLKHHYKNILLGFLSGLSNVIANSNVILDPVDPNTYVDLFSGLTSNLSKRSQELQQVSNEQDVKKLIEQDLQDTKQQLAKVNETLEQTLQEKDSLQARIEDIETRVFDGRSLTALQRKQYLKDKEYFTQKLAGVEASTELYRRQQDAIETRQKTIKFIKENPNLAMFYRTIETRLQALFTSILAVQGGYVKRETTSASIKSLTIPFMGVLISNLKAAISPVLSKLNEKEQKQEWDNISTFGNIEELNRIASDTAGILTLYYREQLESIDTSKKIKGSNMFNDKVRWIKDFIIDVRPESREELAVVIVADYIASWIIDALKVGTKNIDPNQSLPHYFWLYVAQQNPADQTIIKNIADNVGLSTGQQLIPLKTKTSDSNQYNKVPLCYLICCVTVISNEGEMYQSRLFEPENLKIFGYVYLKPFSSNRNEFFSIVEKRNLRKTADNALDDNDLLSRVNQTLDLTSTYAHNDNGQQIMANQVAQVLGQQKTFVNAQDLHSELKKFQKEVELDVEILREDIHKKTEYYQTSIDAAHEKIEEQSKINRETMQKDNEAHYERILKKFNDKFNDIEIRLNEQAKKRLNDVEQELREKTKEILITAESAKLQALQAIEEANHARQGGEKAVQEARKAAISAQNLAESTEQRRQEFQLTASNCEATVQRTVASLIQMYEKTISDMRVKLEDDVAHAKEAVREASQNAKDAAANAREVQRTTKEQLDLQKRETEKTLAGIKETRAQCERAVVEAREAEKHAKRAANTAEKTLEQVDKLTKKM